MKKITSILIILLCIFIIGNCTLITGNNKKNNNKDTLLLLFLIGSSGSGFTPARGEFDPDFGAGGIVITPIGSSDDFASAIALQPDGKILVAGSYNNGSNRDIVVIRYNSNGSLDTSFGGGDGKVTTPIGSSDDFASAITLQPDGKILVAGSYNNGSNRDIVVIRYNSNGSLDTSFGGGDGKVTTPIGSIDDLANAIVLQPDGKILVAGYYINGSNSDIFVVRYNSNGSLDTSFDGDGTVTTSIGSFNDEAYAIALQPDGKILVAGYYHNGSNNDILVVRYNSNGSLDTSFDGDGTVTTSIGSFDDVASAITLQPDGKILVTGYYDNGSKTDIVIVRYNSDGSLDTSFGNGDGIATLDIGSSIGASFTYDYANEIALQPDGKILVTGYYYNGSNYDVVVVRYNSNGSLDTSFGGGDGKVTTPIGSGHDYGSAIALQPDGKILVTGYYEITVFNTDIFVVRYNSNGSLDTSFDGDGKVTTPIGNRFDEASAIALQPDGKILVAGYYEKDSNNNDVVVIKYNSNGSLDTSFDGDGKVTTPIGSSDDFANAIALQPDGKILVTGNYYNGSNSDIFVVRYNSNGSLDTSFDGDGKVTTPIGINDDYGYAIALQPDGKILVAGYYENDSNNDIFVIRYK